MEPLSMINLKVLSAAAVLALALPLVMGEPTYAQAPAGKPGGVRAGGAPGGGGGFRGGGAGGFRAGGGGGGVAVAPSRGGFRGGGFAARGGGGGYAYRGGG